MRRFPKVLALTIFILSPLRADETVLHLYNWADYMVDDVLEQFQKETGIRVKSDYFASNEELIAKMQSGAFAYDVVVPSDYYVKIFIAQGLAQPLDHAQLPNRKSLDPRFQNPPYDPDNRHSVPYFWGTTGIGYSKKYIHEPIASWRQLFDPRWSRKVNLLDDMREVLGIPLRLSGVSINTIDLGALERTRKDVIKQKEHVRTYNSSTYKEILNAGDVWITQGYSGDILQLRRENSDIVFVNPKEGGSIFVDNLLIPKASRHKKEAHAFINFILRPEIAVRLAEKLGFATPNREARLKLPLEVQNDPAVYPPEETVQKLEYIEDVGPTLTRYEDIWMDLKTR